MLRQYIAPQGAVWDWLSWKIFGDGRFIAELLAVNPKLRHIVRFNEPTIINVPEKPKANQGATSTLPPWKQ